MYQISVPNKTQDFMSIVTIIIVFVIRNTLFRYRIYIDLSVSFAGISKMNEKKMKGKNKEECHVSALHTSMNEY